MQPLRTSLGCSRSWTRSPRSRVPFETEPSISGSPEPRAADTRQARAACTGHVGINPAEGWYRDPFGIHEDRWMSQGQPTKLVRDGGAESYDPPPDLPLPAELVPAESDGGAADEAGRESGYSDWRASRAAL